jgi:hypothetical protein
MVDDFFLHIDADAANTFFQLHELFQEACNFDPSQLVTFFAADEEWDKKNMEIKMFPDPSSSSKGIMRDTTLDKFLENEGDKMLYVFDIINDKSLYIELSKIQNQQISIPVILLKRGNPPFQSPPTKDLPLSGILESQHYYDDLGELEDLYGIYGEMSSHIF